MKKQAKILPPKCLLSSHLICFTYWYYKLVTNNKSSNPSVVEYCMSDEKPWGSKGGTLKWVLQHVIRGNDHKETSYRVGSQRDSPPTAGTELGLAVRAQIPAAICKLGLVADAAGWRVVPVNWTCRRRGLPNNRLSVAGQLLLDASGESLNKMKYENFCICDYMLLKTGKLPRLSPILKLCYKHITVQTCGAHQADLTNDGYRNWTQVTVQVGFGQKFRNHWWDSDT